jgi:hypothetical protein
MKEGGVGASVLEAVLKVGAFVLLFAAMLWLGTSTMSVKHTFLLNIIMGYIMGLALADQTWHPKLLIFAALVVGWFVW